MKVAHTYFASTCARHKLQSDDSERLHGWFKGHHPLPPTTHYISNPKCGHSEEGEIEGYSCKIKISLQPQTTTPGGLNSIGRRTSADRRLAAGVAV